LFKDAVLNYKYVAEMVRRLAKNKLEIMIMRAVMIQLQIFIRHPPGATTENHDISSVRIPRVPAEIRTRQLSLVIFTGYLTTLTVLRLYNADGTMRDE
jgi:hypothetical protein